MAALRFSDLQQADTIGSGPVQPLLPPWKTALLVAAGGGLGAALRLVVTLAMPTVTTPTLVEVPWATLWVNVLGCLGLGGLVGALEVRPGRNWMRPLLGTGLCGGFTTMSGVVLEGSAMIGAEFPIPALGYALATVALCLGAVLIGFLLGRRLARRPGEPPALDRTGATDGTGAADTVAAASTDIADDAAAAGGTGGSDRAHGAAGNGDIDRTGGTDDVGENEATR